MNGVAERFTFATCQPTHSALSWSTALKIHTQPPSIVKTRAPSVFGQSATISGIVENIESLTLPGGVSAKIRARVDGEAASIIGAEPAAAKARPSVPIFVAISSIRRVRVEPEASKPRVCSYAAAMS